LKNSQFIPLNQPAKTCDRIIYAGLLFLLLFAPLAFGSVHVWAYSVIQVLVFSLLGTWVLDRFFLNKDGFVVWIKTPVSLPVILLILLFGIQWMPLPASWVAFLSPKGYADKLMMHQALDGAGVGAGPPTWTSIAYYRYPVRLMGLKLLSCAGMFFLVVHTVTSKKRIMGMVYTLVAVGFFESIYGFYQLASDSPRVWWWVHARFSGRATGTYIAPNHYAGYLLMALLLTLGCMVARQPKQKRMVSGLGGRRVLVQRVVAWFAPEAADPGTRILLFAAIFMGLAIFLSGSREGILSMTAALFAGVGIVGFHRYFRWRHVAPVLFCLTLLGFGMYLGIGHNASPDKGENRSDVRRETVREILPMIGEYPVLGVGGGNFRYLYPRYMADQKDKVSSSGHAHNDWIESGCDTGIAGLLIFIGLFVGIWVGIFRVWRSRSDRFAMGIGAGVMGALLSMGFYGFMDINMHIPATPLTLSALSGVGFVVVHRQRKGYLERFFYAKRTIRPAMPVRIVAGAVVLLGLGGAIIATGRHFISEIHSPTEWNSTLNLNWNPDPEAVETALSYAPGNAENHLRRALTYAAMGAAGETARHRINEQAISAFRHTLSLNPTLANVWHDLGYRLSYKTYDPYHYMERWLPAADRCFDAAARWAPMKPDLLMSSAWYWVWRAHLLPETEPETAGETGGSVRTRQEGIRKFQDLFQRSLRLKPESWKKAARRVREYYPDDTVILGIVPPENEALQKRVLQWVVTNS